MQKKGCASSDTISKRGSAETIRPVHQSFSSFRMSSTQKETTKVCKIIDLSESFHSRQDTIHHWFHRIKHPQSVDQKGEVESRDEWLKAPAPFAFWPVEELPQQGNVSLSQPKPWALRDSYTWMCIPCKPIFSWHRIKKKCELEMRFQIKTNTPKFRERCPLFN